MKTGFFDEILHYERALIGAILAFPDAYQRALAAGLQRGELPTNNFRLILDCAAHLNQRSLRVELPTVCAELAKRGLLETIGGEAYVSALIDGVPGPDSVPDYVAKLKEAASRKRAESILENGFRRVMDSNMSAVEFVQLGQQLIGAVSGQVSAPTLSEEAIALRFAGLHAEQLRYVHRWGSWMIWDGSRWVLDQTQQVLDRVRELCRSMGMMHMNSEKSRAIKVASQSTASNALKLTSTDRRVAATAEQWDHDPWSLNTPSGTVDLQTGEVRQHCKQDYITKTTVAGPGGDCPLWLRFLESITNGGVELQSFLQRLAGYALSGSTSEQALFFLYGTGANGKSVFLSTLSALLGGYAKATPSSSLTAHHSEQHPTEIARLQGVRLVTAIEIEDGARWAESRIKELTGGDRIAARFMRCDFFEFVPQFKLLIAGNHKPAMRNVDEAIRRRLHLIPFSVTIPKEARDPQLGAKLRSEYPGILAWAIRGCLEWRKQGLNPPTVVRQATAEYLSAEDLIGRWIEDRAVVAISISTPVAVLYADHRAYCQSQGEVEPSCKRFVQQLMARGFRQRRTSSAREILGISLRTRR
jgi:P4 family phage/plasmid primase-like protien